MNGLTRASKKIFFTLLAGVLAMIGTFGVGTATHTASAAAAVNAYVYYVSNDVLYRMPTNGGAAQTIAEKFDGNGLLSTGKYLYFMYDESSTSLQRLSLTDPDALITSFGGDKNITKYMLDGDYLYFMDDAGSLYRSLANAEDDSQTTLVADNADPNFPTFTVVGGRIYYNALKNKTTTWAASKAKDGSGNVQWIASGAIQNDGFTQVNKTTLLLMIDTIPTETEYSLNSMVLYSLPLNGGNPKAANAKTPLDANSVFAGAWSDNYFLYNKGIKLDANGDNNFSTGKGYLLDKNGKIIQLSQTGVLQIAEMGNNKLTYIDAKGKAYVTTIANGKVTGTKALALSNVAHITTQDNGGIRTTVFYTSSDAYLLNADLTLTKLAGVEWDYTQFTDNIPGMYYINGKDNDCLYRIDGKTKIKLTSEPVSMIALVSVN